ncbi:MAG: XRE family transcriptional regulator [Pseudonocardia sediminis]
MSVTGWIAAGDAGTLASSQLAGRLRALRRSHWPDRLVRQIELATAFDVSPSSISSWEKTDAPTLPPEPRLDMYARFFASRRSVATTARLLNDDELTDDESTLRTALYSELYALHETATSGAEEQESLAGDFWTFPDGGPIRVICGVLEPERRSPSADVASADYVELGATADLDSLFELFGHLRMRNPSSDVRFVRADQYDAEDLQAHVILLGNTTKTGGPGLVADQDSIPVRQLSLGGPDGEVFELLDGSGTQLRPRFTEERLVEDVGLFARTSNPYFSTRTLTVCGGAYTRGVYGAVRCLTDGGLGDENAAYLRRRAAGAETFGVVMRVRTADHIVPTPDLRDPRNRLFEFPAP